MSYPANALPAMPPRRQPYTPNDKRQAYRRGVREDIAREGIVQRRREELRAAIAEIESQKEAAAADHVSGCRPIQTRLAEIQGLQVAEIADRAPKSEKLEQERLRLQTQLNQHNESLAAAIRIADDKIAPLAEEYRKLPQPTPKLIYENRLITHGDHDKLDELFTTSIGSWWAQQRLDVASAHLMKLTDHRDANRRAGATDCDLEGCNAEIAKFQAEVAAAGKALAASRANEERLRAELIDE